MTDAEEFGYKVGASNELITLWIAMYDAKEGKKRNNIRKLIVRLFEEL